MPINTPRNQAIVSLEMTAKRHEKEADSWTPELISKLPHGKQIAIAKIVEEHLDKARTARLQIVQIRS
jgi:hypothetical protein